MNASMSSSRVEVVHGFWGQVAAVLFGFFKIQTLNQHRQLRIFDGQFPLLHAPAIPDAEAAGFQHFAVHHKAARLPSEQLDAVALAVEEDVDGATHRRLLHVVRHERLEAVEALAHVARRDVQPEPHVTRQAQHLNPRVGGRSPVRSRATSPQYRRGNGSRGCKWIL